MWNMNNPRLVNFLLSEIETINSKHLNHDLFLNQYGVAYIREYGRGAYFKVRALNLFHYLTSNLGFSSLLYGSC